MIAWKLNIVSVCILLAATRGAAQYSLRLVASAPAGSNPIFVTGSFNNWNPGENRYRLQQTGDGRAEITILNIKPGNYTYKFTRGNAAKLECSSTGTNIKPHVIEIRHDTSIFASVVAWSDAYFDLQGLPDSLMNEAMMGRAGYYVEINLDSSYKYAVQLYNLSKKLGLPIKEARALDLQATIFTRQGNGQKALELLMTSLAIKKNLNDSSGGTAFTYNNMGKIYESMGDFANARENYLNSASWINKANEMYKAGPLAANGKLFLMENNIDSAFKYGMSALKYGDHYYGAQLLMGDIECSNKAYTAALHYYRAACLLSERGIPGTPNYDNPADALKKIAVVYDSLRIKDSAYLYARKAFAISSKVNNPAGMVGAATVLMNLFSEDKKFDSSFIYQTLVMKKKDSLFTIEKQRQVHNIYFNERLRQQEFAANEEKRSAQTKIYWLTGLSALVILLGLAYRLVLKNRFYKQLSEIEMRALRAQMNPHFIFNCLASINRYIIKNDTKAASSYLTKFSKLIRLILDNSSNELVSIDTEIQTLKLYMDMELLRFDNSFEYEIVCDKLGQTDSAAIPAMIIQPYVENAIWHGLLQPGPNETLSNKKKKLWLRFLPHTSNTLAIEIEDNGIGRKKAGELRDNDVLKTKSYGMQISKDRIELINSQYRIQSSVQVCDLSDKYGNAAGTKVVLYLPVIEMTAIGSK